MSDEITLWHLGVSQPEGNIALCGVFGAMTTNKTDVTCAICLYRMRTLAEDSERTEADMVNHPPHYSANPSGVECIDVVEHMNFNRGNAVKYLWRAGSKGGAGQELEDLRKAAWYLEREIARLSRAVEEAGR